MALRPVTCPLRCPQRKTIPHADPAPFAVRSVPAGNTLTLEVTGEIDMITAPEIARMTDLAADGTSLVIVDLSDVSFVDSTGLNVLFTCRRMLDGRDIALRVVVPEASPIRRVFEITQMTDRLNVVAERAAAFADSEPTIG